MSSIQPGILGPVPRLARYLIFNLSPGEDPRENLHGLSEATDGDQTVVGLGQSLVLALNSQIEGLRLFPCHAGPGFEVPSTPASLWCWLKGEDRGELLHRTRAIEEMLSPAFILENVVDAFQYGPSLDLTGYEDGTENPKGEQAEAVATLHTDKPGLEGSSFVAVQQWIHDLDHFESMPQNEQDTTIGRRKSDNEEMDDAPESAHVKRTAQESFSPEAFILRRSMPWADEQWAGLVFVAFGKSFDAYEALLKRMVGEEDGIPDALFRFTRPVTGSYFWCPPVTDGRLNLSALE